MFISFDPGIADDEDAAAWLALSPVVRLMMHAFEYRRHVFYLTGAQVEAIRKFCGLGRSELAILDVFLNRRNDFYQWFKSAKCHLKVAAVPAASVTCGDVHEVKVPPKQFLSMPVINEGFLLAENIENDARWYKRLATIIAPAHGLTGLTCGLTPTHGGGGDLGSYFEHAKREGRLHYVVLDADRAGEWERLGETPKELLRKSVKSGCIGHVNGGMSDLLPFFGLSVLPMRQATNTIPPALIREYYTNRDRKPAAVDDFQRMFPNFPTLSDSEWVVWKGLNFESLPSSEAFTAQFAGSVDPDIVARIAAVLGGACEAIIPKKTTARLLEWERDGSHAIDLQQWILPAMGFPPYHHAMDQVLRWPLHLGSAYASPIT